MSKNTQLEDQESVSHEELSLTCNFGFDFKRRYNLVQVSENVVGYVIDNLLTFLNVATKEKIYLRSLALGDIGMFAVHPHKTHIAIGENGTSPSISIYKYPSLELERTIRGGAEAVYSTGKFSHDGSLLASVSGLPDYWFTLWDWKTGAIVLRAKTYGQEVFGISFLSEKSEQIITHGTGHIQFWKMVKTFTGLKLQGTLGKFNGEPLSDITGALELPFRNMVLTSTEFGALFIWSDGRIKIKVMRGTPSADADCHNCAIGSLAYVDGESMILTVGEDGWIKKWSVEDISKALTSKSSGVIHLNPISESLIANTNIRALCVLGDQLLLQDIGEGSILSMQHGTTLRVLSAHNGPVTGVVSSLNTSHLYTCGEDGGVHCYNYLSCSLEFRRQFIAGATALVNVPLILDKTGKHLIVGFVDGVIRVLMRDDSTWRLVLATKPLTCRITSFVWTSTGKRLAVVGEDGTVFIFDSSSFEQSKSFEIIGFVRFDALPDDITWTTDCEFTAQINAEMRRVKFTVDNSILEKVSHEIVNALIEVVIVPDVDYKDKNLEYQSLSGRVRVVRRGSTLTIFSCSDGFNAVRDVRIAHTLSSMIVTHDDCYLILTFKSGSFEMYALGDENTWNRDVKAEAACSDTLQLHEVADITTADHLSIEQSLKLTLEIKAREKYAKTIGQIATFADQCRDKFDALVAENSLLAKSAQISSTDLVIDDMKTQQIREHAIELLAQNQDELKASVRHAESLTRRLQAKYFDKFEKLPQIIHTEDRKFQCASFCLKPAETDVAVDTTTESLTVPSAIFDIEARASVSDGGQVAVKNERTTIVSVEDESQITSEARRRAERLERNAKMQQLKTLEPSKTTQTGAEALEHKLIGCGFPLRCDPDSRVPPEEKLTTVGKIYELREIEEQLRNFQSTFNEHFEAMSSEGDRTYDMFSALCYAKVNAISKCKAAQLSRLVVLQELAIVPEYDAKNLEMQNMQNQYQEDIDAARIVVRQAEIAMNDQEEKLERQEKVKAEIQDEFESLMTPGVPRKALIRVLQKRIVNEIKSSKIVEDCDSSSDCDSDFDDEASYYSSSDEEDGGTCPKGCDQLVYENICELRERRFDALDVYAEIQRGLELCKKAYDLALKKLRSIEESARVAEENNSAFEKAKQQSLNGIHTGFVLPVSSINLGDKQALNCDELLIFSKKKMLELESQITKWETEVTKLKRQHHELKREHASLVAQRSEKTTNIQRLQQKYVETQIRKFGKQVVLEELDKVSYSEGADELKEKLRLQEVQNDKDIEEINREIMAKERALINITAEHTSALDELLSVTSAQLPETFAKRLVHV